MLAMLAFVVIAVDVNDDINVDKKQHKQKIKFSQLIVSPRLMLHVDVNREVYVSIGYDGPAIEEYYCMGYTVEWGDGSVTGVESDCKPFEQHEDFQRHYSHTHTYRIPGNHRIVWTFYKGDRVLKRFFGTVHIHGY